MKYLRQVHFWITSCAEDVTLFVFLSSWDVVLKCSFIATLGLYRRLLNDICATFSRLELQRENHR